jgi:hypothetical protein
MTVADPSLWHVSGTAHCARRSPCKGADRYAGASWGSVLTISEVLTFDDWPLSGVWSAGHREVNALEASGLCGRNRMITR